jgi:hypothetical protein
MECLEGAFFMPEACGRGVSLPKIVRDFNGSSEYVDHE